jgi:hypothetical protein
MPDYQKGKIYKLWSPQGDEIYIGSTIQLLHIRKSHHKNKSSLCQSKILFEKYDDVRIELLEEYPCNSKDELQKKEGEYIRNNDCVNKKIPCRTKKEYYEDNKEEKKKIASKYREDNKEKIKENRTTPFVCECGRTIQLMVKARHLKTKIHNDLMEELK